MRTIPSRRVHPEKSSLFSLRRNSGGRRAQAKNIRAGLVFVFAFLLPEFFAFAGSVPQKIPVPFDSFKGERVSFGSPERICVLIPDEEGKPLSGTLRLPVGRIRINARFLYSGTGTAYLENVFSMQVGKSVARASVANLAQGNPLAVEFIHDGTNVKVSFSCIERTDKAIAEKKKLEAEQLLAETKEKRSAGSESEGGDDLLGLMGEKKVHDVTAWKTPLLLLEKLEVERLSGPVVIESVLADRVTYRPGMDGTLSVKVRNLSASVQMAELDARIEQDLAESRTLESRKIELAPKADAVVEFPFSCGTEPWGRGFHVTLKTPEGDDFATHAVSVVTSPWQVLLVGAGWPQSDSGHYSNETAVVVAATVAAQNMTRYAPAYEAFAWEPSAFSDMTPDDDEPYYAGQLQYCFRRSNLQILHEAFRRRGIACISYFFPSAGGYRGIEHALAYPEHMATAIAGFGHGSFSTDILDRMRENRYRRNTQEDFWSLWISSGTNHASRATVDWACNEIVESAKMLGWDGLRFDGRFRFWNDPVNSARLARYVEETVRSRNPDFAFGYNAGGKRHNVREGAFSDFELAAVSTGGNYVMTEFYRHLSGNVKTNIAHLQNFGDVVRLHGGCMLAMADGGGEWNYALMLAGGARVWLGGFDPRIEPFYKFVTRYSAFVLDPAMRRIENPGKVIEPVGDPGFLWDSFVYERSESPSKVSLVFQLVNVSDAFVVGGEGVPQRNVNPTRRDVRFRLRLPDGYRAKSVFATDDRICFQPMAATLDGDILTIPRVALWTLAVVEIEKTASAPALFEFCRKPLDFASYEPEENATEKDNAELMIGPGENPDPTVVNRAVRTGKIHVTPELVARLVPAGALPDGFGGSTVIGTERADFSKHRGALDRQWTDALERKPMALVRNGVPDIHYARGCFYHRNRLVESLARLPDYALTFSGIEKRFYGRDDEGPFCDLAKDNRNFLPGFPDREGMQAMDILILDNIPMGAMSLRDRVDIADFVEAGGSLLVLGGWYALSKGAYEGSRLEDALPVLCRQERYLLHLPEADRALTATDAFKSLFAVEPAVFSATPNVEWVNHVLPKPGAQVLMTAGEAPVLVAGTFGKGRVVVWAGAHSGRIENPYWEQSAWPETLTASLLWLNHASGERQTANPVAREKVRKIMDDLELEVMAGNTDSPQGDAARRLKEKLEHLLSFEQDEAMRFVAGYLLAHPGTLSLADASAMIDRIVPCIVRSPEWEKIVEPYVASPPPGLARLVAEIAAVNLEKLPYTRVMAWSGIDDVTRLRCIARSGDPEAIPYLEAMNRKLDDMEAAWDEAERNLRRTSDIYESRLLRPFVNHALLSCGKRDADTVSRLARACVELPFYVWRQHWILWSAENRRWSRDTVLKGDAAIRDAQANLDECRRKCAMLVRADRFAEALFTSDALGTDEIGLKAAEEAIQAADCHKSIPRCLQFLRGLKPEQLETMPTLRDASLPEIRNSYTAWTR